MCNCIEEIENKLKELADKNKEWKDRKITSARIENECFTFVGGVKLYSYEYCPFCGKRYKDGD